MIKRALARDRSIVVSGTAPSLAIDVPAWCRARGHALERRGDSFAITAGPDRWRHAERAGGEAPVADPPARWGLAARGALVAGILAHHGYQAGAEQQPQAVVDGIRLTVSLYCSIPFLIAVALLFLYKIDKDMETRIEHDLHMSRNN